MSDRFLTTIITDLAQLRIRIDSIPHRPLRDSLEAEYQAKYARLMNSTPTKFRPKIDEMIEEEIELRSRGRKK